MKSIITAVCLTLLFSCNKQKGNIVGHKQSKDPAVLKEDSIPPDKIPQTIDEIRKEFAVLNEKLLSKKLDSNSFSYTCDEIEGKADFYYEKKDLRMVKHFFADSHFSSVTNYYVKSDKVFFIFKEETVWQFDGGTPEKPITKDSISQQRIYLKNGKPIQCLEKHFTIRSTDKNINPETIPNKKGNCDVKELMDVYRKILNNKDTKNKPLCL